MITLGICLSIGILFAAGTYLFMHRNAIRAIIGLMLLSNAVNLAVLAVSNAPTGKRPPIVEKNAKNAEVKADPNYETALGNSETDVWAGKKSVDPLPQALILTAIVIGFGVMAFMIALVYCTHAEQDTVLLYRLEDAETPDASEKKQKESRKGKAPPDDTAEGTGLQFLPFAVSDGFMEVEDSTMPSAEQIKGVQGNEPADAESDGAKSDNAEEETPETQNGDGEEKN